MIRTLQQRLIFFLLLPSAFLLIAVGILGFLYARGIMLDQWREAAILKLERAAHHIDMRLSQPIALIEMLQKAADDQKGYNLQAWIIEGLKKLDGVTNVSLYWTDGEAREIGMRGKGMGGMDRMHSRGTVIAEVTPPIFDADAREKTISLVSFLDNEKGETIGRLQVTIGFEYLMQDIQTLGWWQSDMGCLVDAYGNYLAHTKAIGEGHKRLGETDNPLELAVLKEMRTNPYGTILGPGHPSEQVAGFYKIRQAPWVIILFAPGDKILAPIIAFRFYYAMAGGLFILLLLLLLRHVGGKVVHSISEISGTARRVTRGEYGDPLPIETSDEIGQLRQAFNAMVAGLKEKDFISNTFGRYVDHEVARELMRRPEASRLGGEKREVAILMSDLRGFTPLSETQSPEVTIKVMNRYFSRMIETVQHHRGIIVDFFGDAMLVFFDPMDGPVQPVIHDAIQCGLEMQSEMMVFNGENRAKGLPELQMGIGINAGEVIVGNIGSETRAKYGIVGSAVNMTQRIQSRAEGGEVVISPSVYRTTSERLLVRKSYPARLKGIQDEMTLYVIKGLV